MSRRAEIIRRATEVFERQGVNRTSFEDIAQAVGIKREAIYYYFKSRAELLLEVILPQSVALLNNIRLIQRTQLSSREKLHEAIRNHLDSFNPNYLEMSVALREDHFFGGDDRLTELRLTWQNYDRVWSELIAEGQAAGEFRPDLDAKMLAYGILGMCNWVTRWYHPGKDVTISDLIETYFTMIADGITGGIGTGPDIPGD
jgi:AcrR family transcriptional regulator